MRVPYAPIAAALLAVFSIAASAPAAADAVLSVEAISGLVQVQRAGKQYSLREGEAVQVRDVLITDEGGRATLNLGRHGFIEIGSNAQVAFEQLPYSSYARDLKTVFALGKGYLRVVWKRPQSATAWPLTVVMGSTRAVLGSGEYFFQQGPEQRLCAAAGVLAVQTPASVVAPEQVRPPACAQVQANGAVEIAARSPNDWIAVRRAFSVRAGEPVIAEVVPSARQPNAPAPSSLAADMPAPKPGMDYSLLEGQPGLATTSGASARSAPPPAAPAAPPVAAVVPPPATPNPFEVPTRPADSRPSAAITAMTGLVPVPPPLAAPVKGTWRINVGAYAEPAGAQPLLQQASALAMPVRQTTVFIEDRPWYHVQVGAYATALAAQADAARVKAALGVATVWFTQDQ